MEKILYLSFNETRNNNIVLDAINDSEGCAASCVLKSVSWGLRVVRRIHICLGLPCIGVWLEDWKNEIYSYSVVICVASRYSGNILKWIKKKNQNCRCINYYWDSVEVSQYPVTFNKDYENWSFYEEDCKKYNFRYNPQFYINNIKLPDNNKKYDITYVGADRGGQLKDRSALVEKYYRLFNSLGLNTYFYYVTNSDLVSKEIKKDKLIPELEFYNISSKGRAILDIVEPNIFWLTFRPLVALSNRIKVVTNNRSIRKEKFYSKDNVFILGIDDECSLSRFLKTRFVSIDIDNLEYYEFNSWLQRFFNSN